MKAVDAIFALISGYIVGWVARDFLNEYGVDIGFWYILVLHYAIPVFSVFCLWVAGIIGRRFLFVYQAAKHILVGALATVIDLKFFELFVWLFSLLIFITPVFSKTISFLISTLVKYWGNKYWAFEKREKEGSKKELLYFFAVTVVGLGLDVALFYFFAKIMGPQFSMPDAAWVKFSVLLSALGAAVWNFSAYKFLVFKK